jgi:hypothetical protein
LNNQNWVFLLILPSLFSVGLALAIIVPGQDDLMHVVGEPSSNKRRRKDECCSVRDLTIKRGKEDMCQGDYSRPNNVLTTISAIRPPFSDVSSKINRMGSLISKVNGNVADVAVFAMKEVKTAACDAAKLSEMYRISTALALKTNFAHVNDTVSVVADVTIKEVKTMALDAAKMSETYRRSTTQTVEEVIVNSCDMGMEFIAAIR